VTVSFSKSISVLHASIRENERRARLAGDQQAASYWAGREQQFQEVLHRANRAALEYLQGWAGSFRWGAHGSSFLPDGVSRRHACCVIRADSQGARQQPRQEPRADRG